MASGITCAALVALVWPLAGRAGRIWAVGAAAVAVLAVGWSRIALGVHWPSDVLAGWLAAAALLGWATVAVELWRPGALARDFRRVDRRTRPRVQRVLARGAPTSNADEAGDEDGDDSGDGGSAGSPRRARGDRNSRDDGDELDDPGDPEGRDYRNGRNDQDGRNGAGRADAPRGAADEAPVPRRHS